MRNVTTFFQLWLVERGFCMQTWYVAWSSPTVSAKVFFFVLTAAVELYDAITDHSGGVLPRGCGYFASGEDARVDRRAWRITVIQIFHSKNRYQKATALGKDIKLAISSNRGDRNKVRGDQRYLGRMISVVVVCGSPYATFRTARPTSG